MRTIFQITIVGLLFLIALVLVRIEKEVQLSNMAKEQISAAQRQEAETEAAAVSVRKYYEDMKWSDVNSIEEATQKFIKTDAIFKFLIAALFCNLISFYLLRRNKSRN